MEAVRRRRTVHRTASRNVDRPGIIHTSQSATVAHEIVLPEEYLVKLRDDFQLAGAHNDSWAGELSQTVAAARDVQLAARRQAQRDAELRRQEQERIVSDLAVARAAELAEQDRLRRVESERIRREAEEEASRQEAARIEAEEEALRREILRIQAEQDEHDRQEAIRFQAEQEEIRRQEAIAAAAEEEERRQRERLRECAVCMEEFDRDLTTHLQCQHWYCTDCLRDSFQSAYDSRTLLRCCGLEVPISAARDIGAGLRSLYEILALERTTPNPTYCARASCAAFIPPTSYRGPDLAQCPQCRSETCRRCRTSNHPGRGCTTDRETAQVFELANTAGWKTCPRCQEMVERRDGCLHMTCRCRTEFCYRCGQVWGLCRERCG